MCIYCNGNVDVYEEHGTYVKIKENKAVGRYLEFHDGFGNLACIKINFCPVCGCQLIDIGERSVFEGSETIKIKSIKIKNTY